MINSPCGIARIDNKHKLATINNIKFIIRRPKNLQEKLI